jgi:hypothetical protein
MLLREWIKADRSRRDRLKEATGAHPITLARWAAGIAIPRADAIAQIEQITDGDVGAADHYAAAQARKMRRAGQAQERAA